MSGPAQPGRLAGMGRVAFDQPLRFHFNGREYRGFRGDTLASALLANGVSVVGRSFKYRRPRGIFSAGEEEPCALLSVGEGARRTPNCRATMVPLEDGLMAHSQLGWPALGFDLGRLADFTRALWPAGFYHKTFKWPNWRTWEPMVRRMTGLGEAPDQVDPDRYEWVHARCDLLICGAGPAGLLAALIAGQAGLRVVLADQGPESGGTLNWEQAEVNGLPGYEWARQTAQALQAMERVLLLPRTTAVAGYDANATALVQTGQGTTWRECLWFIRPRRVLLATGAIEQGLIFPHNDRPGIMQAEAVRHYLNRFGVLPGRHVTVATNNDTAYQTVFDLAAAGHPAALIVDARTTPPTQLLERVRAGGTEVLTGARVAGTAGATGIRKIRLETLSGQDLGWRGCDLLAVSGGWMPRVHLFCHARGTLRFDAGMQCFLPDQAPPGVRVVGAANGTASLAETFRDARDAAESMVGQLGGTVRPQELPAVTRATVAAPEVAYLPPRKHGRQWLDLLHDVTLDDAALAVREGFERVELFKRYTTTGMAADQGKTGNLNAFIALGELTDRPAGEVGVTTFRPPYVPVTMATLAGPVRGERYRPHRYLPADDLHRRLGACFEDYGWMRPDAYPGERESLAAASRREVLAVRRGVGVFDNSPIGKIEIHGPDAAPFIDRFYANDMASLAVGRARYGLMLNENGVIIDDGVVLRLDTNHFLLNTTSAGAGRVTAMLEEWLQCEWPEFRVAVDDMTTQWACFTVAGPAARATLGRLAPAGDWSASAMPHMSVTDCVIADWPARVARVSYSGETSFEISVPARKGQELLAALLRAGEADGIVPYGIEALMMLRLEKGYFHVGTDTDGTTSPDDVGWGETARRKPGDFIGRRSLERAANRAPGRRQLVGLELEGEAGPGRPGGHLLSLSGGNSGSASQGWLTSVADSPTLGRTIGLGMLKDGRGRLGERLRIVDAGRTCLARVVAPNFYDPNGERLHG